MKDDEGLDLLRAKKAHLTDWLDGYQSAQEAVPSVRQLLENTQWEIDTLSQAPEGLRVQRPAMLTDLFRRELDYLDQALPGMPRYHPSLTASAVAIDASGTAAVYDYATHAREAGTEDAVKYADESTARYRNLQAAQDRERAVRDLIGMHGTSSTLRRFGRASHAAASAAVGVGEPTIAALQMRSLLEGVKGDLYARAFEPRENKTWTAMAARLARNDAPSVEYDELVRQESVRGALKNLLSPAAKDRTRPEAREIIDLWAQVLDHIYVVLGLIRQGPE